MMNLYSGTTCPFSQRCRIVLYEKGMDFQVIDVDLFAKPEDIAYAREYLALTEDEGFHWGVLRGGMGSVAMLFVAQLQDYLGLGAGHRMNTPGTQGGNWTWRLLEGELTPALAKKIRRMTELYGRTEKLPQTTDE